MKKFESILTSSLTIIVLLFQSCTEGESAERSSRVDTLPYYNSAEFTPRWMESGAIDLDTFHRIPPFEFQNQLGDTITEKTFDGSVYVTDFFFTSCPGICPKMATNMSVIQEAFRDEDRVLLLSHSVTPDKDRVDVLYNYALENGCIPGKWHLATGSRDAIYELGRKFYFVEEDLGLEKSADEFLHTENFVLIDEERHIRGIYNGLNSAAVRQLITDVRTLLAE